MYLIMEKVDYDSNCDHRIFLAINKVNSIQLLYTIRPINNRAANN